MRHLRFILVAFCFLCPAISRSDEGLPGKTLAELKEVTVFIKGEADKLTWSGSGFLIRTDDKVGYIVTNEHVVYPTVEIGSSIGRGPIRPGMTRTTTMTVKNPKITVVFRSGTKQEQSVKAEILAADEARDLAILKVSDVKDLPKAIDLAQEVKLLETMPVFVLGFPFGKALALNKGNPAITIGKGSVSSIRTNESDEVVVVQIDGAMNPGNSGGPVVDSQGRLVGISVATIKGSSGIGLAISPAELNRVLQGRPSECRFKPAKADKGNFTVQLEVGLVDPFNKVREVVIHLVPTVAVKDRKAAAKDGLAGLDGARKVTLKIDSQKAIGSIDLEIPVKGGLPLTYQFEYVNGEGKKSLSSLHAYLLKGQPDPVEVKPEAKPIALGEMELKTILQEIAGTEFFKRKRALDQLIKAEPKEANRAEVLKALEPLLAETNVFLRRGSVEALGVWGTAETVKVLLGYLDEKEKDIFTRMAAIEALGKLKQESAVEPVIACIANGQLRRSAIKSLETMGPIAEKAVIKLLKDKDLGVRLAACGILKTIGTKESIPDLENAAKDAHPACVTAANEALEAVLSRVQK